MTSVSFTRFWLNPASDLSQGIGFRLAVGGLASTYQTDTTLQAFAAGRVRAVSTPARTNQLAVTLRADSRAQVNALEQWAGNVVCARDPKGRKFYGVYTNPSVTERPSSDTAVVTLTINEVTTDIVDPPASPASNSGGTVVNNLNGTASDDIVNNFNGTATIT